MNKPKVSTSKKKTPSIKHGKHTKQRCPTASPETPPGKSEKPKKVKKKSKTPVIALDKCDNCGYQFKKDSVMDVRTLGTIIEKCQAELESRNCPDIPKAVPKPITIVERERKSVSFSPEPEILPVRVPSEPKMVIEPRPLLLEPKPETKVAPGITKYSAEDRSQLRSKTSNSSLTSASTSKFGQKVKLMRNKKVYRSFGKYVAEELKSLPVEKANVTQRLINEALAHGLMGHLNRTSCVVWKR